MVTSKSVQKEFPPFKPQAYFGGNLLLGGLSYVMLRQYGRFFIFLGLGIVATFIPFGPFLLVVGSAFDALFIAKKLKTKKLPEPRYNPTLMWVAIIIWALAIGVAIFSAFA